MTDLVPHNRRTTSPTIQGFERCHLDAGMVAIIVREFNQWQVFAPATTKVNNTRTEHVLNSTNRSFGLSVGLWMECGTQIQRRTKSRLKCFPQSRCKPSVTIRDDVSRRTMILNDLVGVDLG
ncbi:hypothetical protein Hanom_Chr05g00439931 [Helianthus anomalus]